MTAKHIKDYRVFSFYDRLIDNADEAVREYREDRTAAIRAFDNSCNDGHLYAFERDRQRNNRGG